MLKLKLMSLFLLVLISIGQLHARSYQAQIDWQEKAGLSTTVSGKVSVVPVKRGALVRKGQVLLRLDPLVFNAMIRKTRALLRKARVAREEADREMKRGIELKNRTLISVHQLELVKIAQAKAHADFQIALAAFRVAKNNKANSVIRAPFTGLLLSLRATTGTVINVDADTRPLLVLGRVDVLSARLLLGIADSRSIRGAQKLVVIWQGKRYKASLASIAVEPVNKTAATLMYRVSISFRPDKPVSIRIGEKVKVIVE